MGEILGLGITHYPNLSFKRNMSWRIQQCLADPALPARFRSPENWHPTMRAQWGDDAGQSHSDSHRRDLIEQLRKVRTELDAFRPDFVLIWGDDQYENFREDCVPAFAVLAYERITFQPWKGTRRGPNVWDEPEEQSFTVRGHRAGEQVFGFRQIHPARHRQAHDRQPETAELVPADLGEARGPRRCQRCGRGVEQQQFAAPSRSAAGIELDRLAVAPQQPLDPFGAQVEQPPSVGDGAGNLAEHSLGRQVGQGQRGRRRKAHARQGKLRRSRHRKQRGEQDGELGHRAHCVTLENSP